MRIEDTIFHVSMCALRNGATDDSCKISPCKFDDQMDRLAKAEKNIVTVIGATTHKFRHDDRR